ncbi:MAG TPA: penicillin acylase family protein, partial [Myxococcaceae bacterium]|nr:penicillin acylase family protein [Myxococcaceae bacterium]
MPLPPAPSASVQSASPAPRPRAASLLLTLALLATAGCPEEPPPSPRYHATIRRTAHGIPHITAPNLGSLGFGQGHAFAEDHACSLADQILKVRGERARFHGPGPGDAHIASDFAWRALDVLARGKASLEKQPEEARQLLQGFAEGYNHFLGSDGAAKLPCAGQPWLRPITSEEL